MSDQLTYSNFIKNPENDHIFFSTNFHPDSADEHHDVVIFNYGLVCSNLHWKFQIPFFIERGYKVLVHDYRGHYQSSCSDLNSVTFENITNDLYQICSQMKIKSCHIFGHSMGVNVSLEFAKRFPDMVKKMILISGTVMPVDSIMFDTNAMDHVRPVLMKLNSKYVSAFQSFWKYGGWSPVMRRIIKQGGFNVGLVSDDFIEMYMNKIGLLGPDLFFQLLGQMQQHTILAHLPKIQTPTLVVGGDNDKVIPNYLQKLLHKHLSNSQLYILRAGSHVPQVDYPDFINQRALLFLQGSNT